MHTLSPWFLSCLALAGLMGCEQETAADASQDSEALAQLMDDIRAT